MGFLEGTLINPLWTRKIGYYLYGIVGTAALFTWLSWDYDTTIINFELRTKEGAAWVYYRWGGRLWYQLYTYCLSSYFLNKVAIGAIIGAVGTYFFIKGLTLSPETKRVIRGATLIDAKVLSKTLKKTKANIHLGVERIPIPEHDERRSFLILGKAGSGKTQAIMRFLEQIKTLNHSAIVYDRKPDYWHRYYRHDKDILFYPKDKRCLRWNIFDDIRDEDDVHFA
ncbi:MAG: type IV secretion system DNA-binding domain-containing protein, partial [Helicobacteraceae bacterium]|nr:type IV secretion system DNA-binding domain-containing protein [Helicobacteraceae bacterium]